MSYQISNIVDIAKQAGQAILEVYHRDFNIEEKDDKSPLTEADLASHKIIVHQLEKLTPDIPVLSEESAKLPYVTRREWDRYWLVDPLDGTREFIKRNGEFTVNIALIENGQATLGVVYVPVTDVCYYGNSNEGAWKTEGEQAAHAISVTKQRQAPLRIAGSRSHAGDSLLKFLDNVGEHEIVSMGSSLKLCLVAEGAADIYPRLGPTSEWDTAAAHAVVTAAGGEVTDLEMQPLRYNTKDSLLNPYFFVFGDHSVKWDQFL